MSPKPLRAREGEPELEKIGEEKNLTPNPFPRGKGNQIWERGRPDHTNAILDIGSGLHWISTRSQAEFRRRRKRTVIRAAKKFLSNLVQQRLRHKVIGALEVNRHAGVRDEGLSLKSMRNRLELEWHARDIHPWDQGLAPEQAAQRFAEQCLEDVDAAICRLFATLPDTDEIGLRVFDPASGDPIMAGTVTRTEVAATTACSVGMKLKTLGLVYRLANWQFESLGT